MGMVELGSSCVRIKSGCDNSETLGYPFGSNSCLGRGNSYPFPTELGGQWTLEQSETHFFKANKAVILHPQSFLQV